MAASKLDQLRQHSVVVADTGDLDVVRAVKPQDCTTNPSLILKAAQMEKYAPLIDSALAWAKASGKTGEALVDEAMDRLAVTFGVELTKLVPGRVSTEVNADLSFDTQATLRKAHHLVALYKEKGIGTDRLLIKIAATWEGIRAAEILEKEGIQCNLTVLFNLIQAIACAEADIFLVSPFAGRILDWYSKAQNRTFSAQEDPGVKVVRDIYDYYKSHGYKTVVMVAAIRNMGEIEELAGCDRLTINATLLEELAKSTDPLPRKLFPPSDVGKKRPAPMDEKTFRWQMNQDPMATEKVAEGIRNFAADLEKLKSIVRGRV